MTNENISGFEKTEDHEVSIFKKCDKHFNISISLSRERKEMFESLDGTLASLVTPLQHKDTVSRMEEAVTRFRAMKQAKYTTESIECMDDSLCEESKLDISRRESSVALKNRLSPARGSPNRKKISKQNSLNMASKMVLIKGVQDIAKFF
jgi:hypothetical protein